MAAIFRLLMNMFPALVRMLSALRAWMMRGKFGQWIIFYMAGAVGLFIKKIFEFLAISFVAYTWGTPVLIEYVAGPLLGLPQQWQQFISMTRLDDASTIIISALVYRVTSSFRVERKASSPFWGNMTTTP